MLFSELAEIIDPEPHAGALNMAIDEALLRQVTQPTLRIYSWEEPTVSFGYFGTLATAQETAAGRALVRRWTGGGIVEHGLDLTYTLVVPHAHPFFRHGSVESYRLIHDAIASWLAGEGTATEVTTSTATPHSSACFANPVLYDLTANGRKVAGAAQRRTRWGLLHQGSIQTSGSLSSAAEGLASVFGAETTRSRLSSEVIDSARELAAEKYGTTEWLRKF